MTQLTEQHLFDDSGGQKEILGNNVKTLLYLLINFQKVLTLNSSVFKKT